MKTNTKLVLGIILLVIGLILPICTYPVMHSSLPILIKSILSGVLFFSFEILMIPAIAIMGKENYNRITKLLFKVFNLNIS